jgi:uncharacterized ion transporter superfamily protein YfcC
MSVAEPSQALGDSAIATRQATAPAATGHRRAHMLHPVIMMLAIIVAAVAMMYLIGSGEFERHGALVVPGTYQRIAKETGLGNLIARHVHRRHVRRVATASSPRRGAMSTS